MTDLKRPVALKSPARQTEKTAESDPVARIAAILPRLRRYARALTGTQAAGDQLALAALEALVREAAGGRSLPQESGEIALFAAFHRVWSTPRDGVDRAVGGAGLDPLEERTQRLLSGLTANAREALLLHAIEGFTAGEIATILGVDPEEVEALVDSARSEMGRAVAGKVLMIEDEAIIAMDIAAIVGELGHTVSGIARTRAEAVALAARERPDLILADINLADHSSGIDAVNQIFASAGIEPQDLPVVFITAYPERLLTGERPEPAFLITKPYSEEQVRSAVGQAMFFASTRTLTG